MGNRKKTLLVPLILVLENNLCIVFERFLEIFKQAPCTEES
jgi:hypothetical protein